MLSESLLLPKAEFSEIFPKFPNCGFNTRHDNREVTLIEFFDSRICPNIYGMFRSVNWTHDMIIVKWHLFIWHECKLCALTNAPPVQSTQIGRLLSTLFHANCSAAQVYVLYPRNSSSLPAAGDDHSCRYYNPLSAKKDILKNFLCIWWWQMLCWKHVLTRKI